MTKLIVNCQTGEITEVELTKMDLDQQKIDEADLKAFNAVKVAETQAKATAKATAESKLAALGLTTDDLRALGLQSINEALALCSWYTIKRSN